MTDTQTARDLSPIPQQFIQMYCTALMDVASKFDEGPMKNAALARAEHVMDMVEAWQTRNRWKEQP